ncbi:MAG: hypothetical protein K6A63_02215 [Acholeplasmatales bacterium]|nr:hypothetical protein [Acholeplasmatales bacterium]
MSYRLSDDLGIYEINEQWWSTNIRDGLVIKNNASPELDSITIVIDNESSLAIKQWDVVGLNDKVHDEDVFFIVATFTEDVAVYSDNLVKYKYTLNLVSPTKLFENVILPNISNTNIGNNITIKEFLEEKFDYYMSFMFSGLENGSPCFSWDFPDGLGDMVCPEFTLNEPNMRELLNYLWSIKNCTFRCYIKQTGSVYSYVISYLDYNKRGTSVYTSDMIISRSNSIDNSVTHLKSNLGNTINETIVTEVQPFKTDAYVYSTNNLTVMLNNPIYDLYTFKIYAVVKKYYARWTATADGPIYAAGGSLLFEVKIDATDYIFPKKQYESLNIMNPSGSSGATGSWTYPNRNTACYWERGKNKIEGLFTKTEGWLGWTSTRAVEYIIDRASSSIDANDTRLISGLADGTSWTSPPDGYGWADENGDTASYRTYYLQTAVKNLFFEIKYKTYDNQSAVIIEQTLPLETRKCMIAENQTDSIINLEKFITNSVEKINQMGNDTKTFVGMTTDINRLPLIGDYSDDYTVTNVMYTCTNGIYEYQGYMSKDFVNTALFTFVERQKRYTALATADESLQRDEVVPLHSTVSLRSSALSSPKNYTITSSVVKCIFGWDRNDSSWAQYDRYLLMPAKTRYAGNMIAYSTIFPDNATGGKHRGASKISGTDTYPMIDDFYVNSDGEFKGVECQWFEDYSFKQYTDFDDILQAINFIPNQYHLEEVSGDENGAYNKLFSYRFKFIKDNRERISLTNEIIFVSNNTKIIIGNNMARFFVDSVRVVKRTRAFQYLDQIVNVNECTIISSNYDVSSNYNNIVINTTGNIAFVGPNNELLFAINDYNGEYIAFGAPSSSGIVSPVYTLVNLVDPVVTRINHSGASYSYRITNNNIEAVTCTYYALVNGLEYDTETWEYYDNADVTIAAGESIDIGPYAHDTSYEIKVKFSYNGLQETEYIYGS